MNDPQVEVRIAKTSGYNQITARTREGFDGEITGLPMAAGHWGPFFHVTRRRFNGTKQEMAGRYRHCARYSRVRKMRRFLRRHSNDKHRFDLLLTANNDRIEMDADFSLLGALKEVLLPASHGWAEKLFKQTSRERWLGLTEPKNLDDAIGLYAVEHLRRSKRVHLYAIHLDVPEGISGLNPILFCGKVKDGTSMQFKLNNHAVECVSSVSRLASWSP